MEVGEGVNVIKYIVKLFFSMALAILFVSGCKVGDQATSNKPNDPNDTLEKASFVPKSIPSGSNTAYDIHLIMSNDGQFQVDVK